MGISSHQVRLLQLTDRKHTIGLELTRLANDKVDLTRDMNKATKEYQDALSSKVLKWSSNSGISYVDLSYKNLMQPSQMNGNTAYLLTDSSDKVVVDTNYKKYAEMISAKGSAGGNWEDNRTKILSQLIGVPESSITGEEAYAGAVATAKDELDRVIANEPSKESFLKKTDLCCLLEKKVGSNLGTGNAKFEKNTKNWADAYQHGKTIDLGSKDVYKTLESIGSTLANKLAEVFVTESTNFDPKESPIYDAIENIIALQEPVISEEKESSILSKDGKNYKLNVQSFIDGIMTHLSSFINCESTNGNYNIEYYDTTSNNYKQYLKNKETWINEKQIAEANYNNALDASNSLLTADQERQIRFYDDLFSTIADKGWTYNESVNDEDYLNQLLQNGMYTITTVDRNMVEDETTITEDYYWENTYNTDIATNYTNIFAVNDSDARLDAQVEYEKTKAIINTKETQIDTRMQNLKTEQEAINTMIQSIQSMLDENVEDKFGIFA